MKNVGLAALISGGPAPAIAWSTRAGTSAGAVGSASPRDQLVESDTGALSPFLLAAARGSCQRATATAPCAEAGAALAPGRSGVTRMEITRRELAFGGVSFGDVGVYEKIIGRYHAELDPNDPKNAVITDLDKAPRNASGKVEYTSDFYILRPVDGTKANGSMFYEIGNRGRKDAMWMFNDGPMPPGQNDPSTPEQAGDGFLMRRGYTLVWSGVYADVASKDHNLTIQVPIAKNADGSAITGTIWDELNHYASKTGAAEFPLSYAVPTMDKTQATLLVRKSRDDAPTEVPRSEWEFVNPKAVRLVGKSFSAGMIYQLIHRAENPPVMGIGFAAMRDWLDFLRHEPADGAGNVNPVFGQVKRTLALGWSQCGRMLREFMYRGFNEATSAPGRQVIDGAIVLGSTARTFVNFRFGQPGRANDKQHQDLYFPNSSFPFSFEDQRDPWSGKVDGILRGCQDKGTCPKVFSVTTSTDYWQFSSSMVTTQASGKGDAVLPENVRAYYLTGMPHSPEQKAEPGMTEHPVDPARFTFLLRNLLTRLDDWVAHGRTPPKSRIPRLSDGTLVPAGEVKWPNIPKTTFAGPLVNNPRVYDYGPDFERGIVSRALPGPALFTYPVFVPQVDADGNDIAGIRHPAVAVPAATRVGWAVRTAGGAEGEAHPQYGSIIPFAKTAAERQASGDPRLSIEERYASAAEYEQRVRFAARRLVDDGYLLAEDIDAVVKQALAWSTVK